PVSQIRTWGRPHTRLGDTSMAWGILLLAGLLEVAWAVGLKYTEGFTRSGPTVATVAARVGSIVLLSIALRTLPLSTACAVWTGIGTLGASVAGTVLYDEPASAVRLVCIVLILAGIVGLKLAPPV